MYSSEVAKKAINHDCFLIDMREAFLAERKYQRLICNDGIHPNEDGHEFMYKVLEKDLNKTGFAKIRSA